MIEIEQATLQQLLCIRYLFNSGKRPVSFNDHNCFDSYDSHNSYDKFSVLREVGKGLIFPENLLLANTSMVFHIWQCRDTGSVWTTYTAVNNQVGSTFNAKKLAVAPRETMIKVFMAQPRRPKIFVLLTNKVTSLNTRVPVTIVRLHHRLLRLCYPSTAVSTIILLA